MSLDRDSDSLRLRLVADGSRRDIDGVLWRGWRSDGRLLPSGVHDRARRMLLTRQLA